MSATSGDAPERAVLDNVWCVAYGVVEGRVELTPFPSCLRAALASLGETHEYAHLMAASGAAFRLLWHRAWLADNVNMLLMDEDALAPLRQAFEGVGRSFEVLAQPPAADADEVDPARLYLQRCAQEATGRSAGREDMRAAIVESIHGRKRPVLAFGVLGPPECCIITGYDEGGEVLIGWSFFQEHPESLPTQEFEPGGQFRARDWYANTAGIVLIGEAAEAHDPADQAEAILARAITVAERAMVHDRQSGIAAYDAWVADLEDDVEFEIADEERRAHLLGCHDDNVTVVAEGRWYASKHLADVAGSQPRRAEQLLRASADYAAQHCLMWRVWKCIGGHGRSAEHAQRFADPEARKAMVQLIREARRREESAVRHIKRALELPTR